MSDASVGVKLNYVALVADILVGETSAVERFYGFLSDQLRPAVSRMVGFEAVEDVLHEVLIVVLETIRAGELRDPNRLMGFAYRIAHRRSVAHIRQAVFRRRRFVLASAQEPVAPRSDLPDALLDRDDRFIRARRILKRLSRRDREILERFYLLEQSRAQICFEMQLTETQFRLFKSRAIARCSTPGPVIRPARSESRIA